LGHQQSLASNTEKMEHEKEHKEKSSIVDKPKTVAFHR
jgi:hypothetical protein